MSALVEAKRRLPYQGARDLRVVHGLQSLWRITRLSHSPELLSRYFGVPPSELEGMAVGDPYASVRVDVAALKANPALSGQFLVSGLVYDVATGRVQTVVEPTHLRAGAPVGA